MGTTPNCQCKCRNNPYETDMNLPQKNINAQIVEDITEEVEQKKLPEVKTKQAPINLEYRFQRVYPTILKKELIGKGNEVIQESLELQDNAEQLPMDNNADQLFEASFDKVVSNIEPVNPIVPLSQSKNSNKEILNTSTEGFNKNLIQEVDKKEMKTLKYNLDVASRDKALKKKQSNPPEENVMSLKEFSSLRHAKEANDDDYFVDNKLTLRKIRTFKDINISAIISAASLKSNLNDDALFHSELKKLQYGDLSSKGKVKYALKFCVITQRDFRCYASKEKFITLQKPSAKTPLKELKAVTLVSIEGEFKSSMFFFMVNYHTREAYEVYGSSNEETVNKWVAVLNYMLNELRNSHH